MLYGQDLSGIITSRPWLHSFVNEHTTFVLLCIGALPLLVLLVLIYKASIKRASVCYSFLICVFLFITYCISNRTKTWEANQSIESRIQIPEKFKGFLPQLNK